MFNGIHEQRKTHHRSRQGNSPSRQLSRTLLS
jgi:hypothetical protein